MNTLQLNPIVGDIAKYIKMKMMETIQTAKNGHLGACCSSNELMCVLYYSGILKYDVANPSNLHRDYVLARGHVGPLRYNIFCTLGWLKPEEMKEYRKYGSRLPGHEDMQITPGVDLTPSGSLGMLLSYSVGAAVVFRNQKKHNKIFCFLGDGEEQEGNVSEAARHATTLSLNNIIVIIDKNQKQLSCSTSVTDDNSNVAAIWAGYGWRILEIHNGHDVNEIYKVYQMAISDDGGTPVCIIANTVKGNGVLGAKEHINGYHMYDARHSNLQNNQHTEPSLQDSISSIQTELGSFGLDDVKQWIKQGHITCRFNDSMPDAESKTNPHLHITPKNSDASMMYGYLRDYLIEFVKQVDNFYILTADYPPRILMQTNFFEPYINTKYFNVGIREQHMLAMAHGIRVVDSTAKILILIGDAFMYRCADQINAIAQCNENLVIYAVQCGLSGALNGSTHQSSGQSGALLTMPGVTMYEPSTKSDWYFAMNDAFKNPQVAYIRTHGDETSSCFGIKDKPFYNIVIGDAQASLKNATLNVVCCGMVARDCFAACLKLYGPHYSQFQCINFVNIVRFDTDVGEELTSCLNLDAPIFTFYNGNAVVLSSFVCRAILLGGNISTLKMQEFGFDKGASGSIAELKRAFQFDSQGIEELIIFSF